MFSSIRDADLLCALGISWERRLFRRPTTHRLAAPPGWPRRQVGLAPPRPIIPPRGPWGLLVRMFRPPWRASPILRVDRTGTPAAVVPAGPPSIPVRGAVHRGRHRYARASGPVVRPPCLRSAVLWRVTGAACVIGDDGGPRRSGEAAAWRRGEQASAGPAASKIWNGGGGGGATTTPAEAGAPRSRARSARRREAAGVRLEPRKRPARSCASAWILGPG